jgi:hypothetical protein
MHKLSREGGNEQTRKQATGGGTVMTLAEHPSPDELAAFLRAELPRPREARLRAHFEAGCIPCLRARRQASIAAHEEAQEGLGGTFATPQAECGLGDLSAIGRRLERLAWLERQEERVGEVLLLELLRLARPEQVEAVRSEDRYQLLGFARYLSARARAEAHDSPERAQHVGRLAVEVADALDERAYLPGAVAASAVTAWGAYGNALRVATDLPGAERAFVIARQRLRRASGERVRLEFLSLLGSLRVAQAAFRQAGEVLEEARLLAQALREEELEARIVLQLAKARGEGGDPLGAVGLLEDAAPLFSRQPGTALALFARQARAWWLAECGRAAEAGHELAALEEAWLETVTAFADRQRLSWLRARVAWAERDLEGAERDLLAIREAFGSAGAYYDYALVCLDLAVLYLEQGRSRQVRQLAEEMHPVFASRQLHHHALAALALFQVAAGAEETPAEWVRQLARYLRHSRSNPYLRFEPYGTGALTEAAPPG